MHTIINVENDFSRYPGARLISDGNNSGQMFRQKYLLPSLQKYDTVIIQLDGVIGYPPAFLREAFRELPNANAIVLITHDYQLQSEIQMYMRG